MPPLPSGAFVVCSGITLALMEMVTFTRPFHKHIKKHVALNVCELRFPQIKITLWTFSSQKLPQNIFIKDVRSKSCGKNGSVSYVLLDK
jgi:hypothetical protein